MHIDEAAEAPVNIRVPADRSQVPMIRAIAETLAVLADFSLDEVADIKLAVDEAAMTVIGGASADAELKVALTAADQKFHAIIQSWFPADNTLVQQGFGWHVLQTLTSSVAVHEGETQQNGRPVAIELSK
ncbi:ATP-binding protein [Williamsia soli]|uniref:ATP-binding protein n=1 Tax=Williamsia soli TaxID=364929 RepID=UPI001A9CFFE6|nr:ATP-binding protein [Williamsia soli]